MDKMENEKKGGSNVKKVIEEHILKRYELIGKQGKKKVINFSFLN